ncbi:hypothetical protein EWM64_g7101, partial [Hericium alpestre]
MYLYQGTILPAVLEQVVQCKDVIAQEYLMEVVIQVFTDDFHLHTLGQFLSATAQLQPKVNIKQIVIALIDRLAAYAAREAENEDPEETKRQEEAAAKRLAERVKVQRARVREATNLASPTSEFKPEADAWGSPTSPTLPASPPTNGINGTNGLTHADAEKGPEVDGEKADKGKEKEGTAQVRKFRGVPENVKLFEVFWEQVVQLIKARPDLAIQDVTALLVSLTNLSLSCYPDRLEYVDQVLGFARDKIKEFSDSPDLHSQQTTNNLSALLVAPINSYQSVLTLLALVHYVPLLNLQTYATRRTLAHSIVSSVLKNETIIEAPEDVNGILELCQVLIKDQPDAGVGMGSTGPPSIRDTRRHGPYGGEHEDVAEEQGWIARMVHLFRAESLSVQFEASNYPHLHGILDADVSGLVATICPETFRSWRRYKNREHLEDDWATKAQAILKFVRQLISILSSQVEAPAIALRLFLLAAQISDECGFEDLTYDLYVEAFTVYEESISESRAQLQAITLMIGTLQGAKVFGLDNYDTLITKAALHGAKLLKKPHQATAVHLASHLWWQEPPPPEGPPAEEKDVEKSPPPKEKEENAENAKAYPHQDSKRVLECLQKCLRIANSATEEIITIQLYVDALDQYLFYLERGATA